MAQVKNRAPAAIQISAEQLLREARERQVDEEVNSAKRDNTIKRQTIHDPQELAMYQAQKRRDFEEKLRHTLHNLQSYIRYAEWEASQLEFRRARSIFERAIDVDYRDYTVWLKYAQFEMKNKFVNHARNVWNRAVSLLPRVSQLWYKFIHMEEMLGQIEAARTLFNRWMEWEPEDQAWFSYINFEERVGQISNAREVYEKYCATHPQSKAYVKYAKWEERHDQLSLARQVFERTFNEVPDYEVDPKFFIEFARFEERCKEYERARAIFKHSLDKFPKNKTHDLYVEFVMFEKKHGSREGIDGVVLSKSRLKYEKELEEDPRNYDVWFDFVRLEEAEAVSEATRLMNRANKNNGPLNPDDQRVLLEIIRKGRERVRDVYERAVAQVPLVQSKTYWKRYIYLWIYYAIFEELQVQDMNRTRDIYKTCLKLIPHKVFTFGKIWILAAQFELRQKNLEDARKLLGQAIGICPKRKIFNFYIMTEKRLGNIDRCRKLFERFLEEFPSDCEIWTRYATMEEQVKEESRVRAIYELAIKQDQLDMPELVWKKYIDFEISLNTEKGVDNAQILYERLLERTQHVKVWISFAKFFGLTKKSPEDSRSIFEKGYNALKNSENGGKEERLALLTAWKEEEIEMMNLGMNNCGTKFVEIVEKKMPKKLKKRRVITAPDGSSEGWEEFYDYIYPDDPQMNKGMKLLELAQKWKKSGAQISSLIDNKSKERKDESEADSNEIDLDDL